MTAHSSARRFMSVLVATAAMCGVAACSGGAAPETADVAWTEPGWMAEKRQSEEVYAEAMSSCLKDAGWDVEASADGTYRFDDQSEAAARAFSEVMTACGDKHGERGIPSREDAVVWYSHALDTAACLEDAGYEVTDPPSEETYVEDVLERSPDTWVPFQDVIDSADFANDAEYQALYARCTQDGPSAALSF
ncbi:hypothetical protein [Xylanimonas protaetiae]|uniref:Lipoprotein n=1 Tax=Xylanimonas protaetiae TaxID=2509457 RepID=A0A4P6FCX3_9MICO|nr:hypothetical protein [Xylanimonas protaetiae]QAY71407.1 hypothetical protein ET471_16355 [Xylanimonas protaetiae]